METEYPGYAIAYVMAAILSFATALITWRRRGNPGNVSFTLLMLSLCVWSFASIFEAGANTVYNKLFWSKWQYIGIATLPPLWLYFAAEFTYQKLFNKVVRVLILIIPVITLALAFTNEFHWLLWSDVTIQPGPLNIAVYDHGIWFYIHAGFSYVLLLLGTFWLIRGMLKSPSNKRRQTFIIITGVLIGWTANILYVFELLPLTGLDLTPLSFTFIAILISWNIFQFRLFDIIPIARDVLLDNMADGVVILDSQDIIVDINPSAIRIIGGQRARSPVGQSIWAALDEHKDLLDNFKGKSNFSTELLFSEDPPVYIGINVSSIYDEKKAELGKIIVIFDITKRRLMEIEEAEQRKLAQALANTAATINSSLDLDEVLKSILENVGQVVPHDTANIALLDVNNMVSFMRIKGYEKYGTENVVPLIECHVDEVANLKKMAITGEASINKNTDEDPEWNRDMPGSGWIKSYMGAPIISKGQVFGFINLDAATPNYFKEEYIPRLQAFANQAAIAIENAQMFKEIVKSANEVGILYEVGLAVTSGLGLENTTKALFKQLKKVVPVDLFYIAIIDQEESIARYSMFEKDGMQLEFGPISLVDRPSLTRYVLEKRDTVYIADSHSKDAEYPDEEMIKAPGHDERSILGVPLMLRNETIGALFLQADKPDAYDPDQIRLVETIANQASIAMGNAQLFEQIQNMAVTDSLTGAYNRRYFYEYAENEIARSRRYQTEMSLLMIDIDHFKEVNDKFGHLVGDETLKMVVKACLEMLRKVDLLCRFGGEEFTVLLPRTMEKDAIVVAERICSAIASKSLFAEEGIVSVTVSIGLTQLRDKDQTLTDLISEADKAMYAAKEAGRNCIKVFSSQE